MGHSTSSGRNGGNSANEREQTSQSSTFSDPFSNRHYLPGDIRPNSRLGMAWIDARRGDATVIIREYDQLIKDEQNRLRSSRNSFIREAAQQEIDRLRREKRIIEQEFIG